MIASVHMYEILSIHSLVFIKILTWTLTFTPESPMGIDIIHCLGVIKEYSIIDSGYNF